MHGLHDHLEVSRLTKNLVLELITPAFSGQSTYDGPPEGFSGRCLKPLLRFWWRTAHPTQHKNLLQTEASLFGSAGEEGQRISVRPKASNFALDDAYLVPLSDMGNVTTEMMYLCYGVIDRVKDGEGRPFSVNTAPMYFSGKKFEFAITFPEEARIELETALWMFSVFGGWGRRSRRSFGSLRVVDYFENYPELTASVRQDAYAILRKGLQLARPDVPAPTPNSLKHTAWSSGMRVLAAPRLFDRAQDAQQALGEGFYRFRRSLGAYRRPS
jgi:CRISPR/Cas system CMR-associated protein Cmr1 (group 7 of RAMP superfamily)